MPEDNFFKDAAEANEASIAQLRKERKAQRKAKKGEARMQDYRSATGKRWSEMTEEEQRADINARMATAGTTPSGGTPYTPKGTTVVQSYKSCSHWGDKDVLIMFDGALKIAGAKNTCLDDPPEDTVLVVDLAGQVRFNIKPWVIDAPPKLAAIKAPPRANPDLVRLNWPDRSAPTCPLDWWTTFINALRDGYAEQGGRVIFSCMGSHGRTGTALASLLLAADKTMNVRTAIEHVRALHCHEAIESKSQVLYLRAFRPDDNDKWLDTCHADAVTHSRTTGFVGSSAAYGDAGAGGYWDDQPYQNHGHIKPPSSGTPIVRKGVASGTHLA